MKLLIKLPARALAGAQLGGFSLPLVVALVLGCALVLRVGLPLWSTLGSEAPADGEPGAGAASTASTRPDLAALQSLALFESNDAAPAAAPPPAMNTALNLRLEGVMLSGDGSNHQAVILSGERRGSYRTGDALPIGANVTVAGIARDHVVIDNRGQREVLWLFAGQHVVSGTGRPATSGTALTGNAAGLVPPPGTEERVVKTAARLAEIISVAPHAENGQLIGYRLTPGARLKDFVQLGFQTNDIVTAVDGIALTDMANLPKLYSLMDGATEVSFSLLRDGVPLNLRITLSPETPAP